MVTLPLTIVTSILVARVLGPEDRGIYGFLGLIGFFALPILMFGSGTATIYFISSKRYRAPDVFCTCITIALLQGAICTLILGALWMFGLLGTTARATRGELIIPILFILPLQGVVNMGTRVALGDSWFALNNRVVIASALLNGGMLLTLVVVLQMGVQGAVIGIVVNNLLLVTGLLVTLVRHYRPKLSFNAKFARDAWSYGLKAWMADIVGFSNFRLDQWILGAIGKPAVLGVYGPAVVISELPWMLPDALALVLFNKITAAGDTEEQANLVERVHRIAFWTVAFVAAGFAVTGPWLIRVLYGRAYDQAGMLLAFLMPGILAFCSQKVLMKFFAGVGSPQYSATADAAGAAMAFLLCLILIPLYGAFGAAVASSIGYAVTGAMAMYVYRRLVAPRRPRLFRPSMADFAWISHQVRLIRARRVNGG